MDTHCPVCGVDLGFPPWKGNSASDEICPCCYIQFGFDDAPEDESISRQQVYREWRQKWVADGMRWSSINRRPPANWNPIEQLRNVAEA